MPTALSKDGVRIADDKTGQGPALILVGGAFQDRMAMSFYAGFLSNYVTIYNHTLRGRGKSSDTGTCAVQRFLA